MKKLLLALVITTISAIGFAQSDGKVISRIQIRHADPQLIFMLLSGTTDFQTPPEISTLIFGFGGGFGSSGFGGGNGGFGRGFGGGSLGLGGSGNGASIGG